MSTNRRPANKKYTKNIPTIPHELKFGKVYIIFSILALVTTIVMLWLTPRQEEDMFIALAGGRDVFAGRLGLPDNWSFMTGGHVWINQNWDTGVIFYLISHLMGFNGLIALKAALIIACAFAAVLAARSQGVPYNICIPVVSIILSLLSTFIDLRADLMTLLIAPLVLWMLYCTQKRPQLIWLVSPLVVVWANLHGGFIFGIGMMLLWAICMCLQNILHKNDISAKYNWNFFSAALVTTLLCGLANPFGFVNLTAPFLMMKSRLWRNVAEWAPMWDTRYTYGNLWGFIAVIGLLAALSAVRLFSTKTQPISGFLKSQLSEREDIGLIIFETALTIIAATMAVCSRRFIPLALLISLPLFAKQVWWLIRAVNSRWIIMAAACITLISSSVGLYNYTGVFKPNYPYGNQGTFFEKMCFINQSFPSELTGFINDNNISGNVLSDWVWEGYLRLYCPQLKMYIGGRAQQVYDEKTFSRYYDLLDSQSPQDMLKDDNVHLIALQIRPQIYDNLIKKVTGEGKWVTVFANGKSLLLIDSQWQPANEIINKLLNNQLVYKNRSTALMSLGACMLSPTAKQDRSKGVGVLDEALKLKPSLWGYTQLTQALLSDSAIVKLLQQDLGKLEAMNTDSPSGSEIIGSRINISKALFSYYQSNGMNEQASHADESQQAAQKSLVQMLEAWH